MAKVKLNPVFEEFRGELGDLVFREVNGRTIVSRKPSLNGNEATPAQVDQRELFRQAAAYGRSVMADANKRTIYQAASESRNIPIFALMVADFLNVPSVDQIDLSEYHGHIGDPVKIVTSDDFGVVGVAVQISDSPTHVAESGAAVETPAGSGRWIFTAHADISAGTTLTVKVVATDRPGGTAVSTQDITI